MSTVLESLQAQLEGPVPRFYLEFLDRYPTSLLTARRAIDDSEDEGRVCHVELCHELSDVLDLNREARSDSVPNPENLELIWPPDFLVIGETGAGDYYCIDVSGSVEGVMQFDHQAVQFEVVADSLDEFVEILEDTFCEASDGSE